MLRIRILKAKLSINGECVIWDKPLGVKFNAILFIFYIIGQLKCFFKLFII